MLTANQLQKQVDLPVWEWLRFAPLAPTAGLSCSCAADNTNFNNVSGRYVYYLINATNFWRYDTISDTYEQLASPPIAPVTASSMRFSGASGYNGRVISATSTTIDTGLPFGKLSRGFRIRIISGKGAGQERIISNVSDPVVADFGACTSATTANITDTGKNWGTSLNSAWNQNSWVGYSARIIGGTGINQVRKVLYNSGTVLTFQDPNIHAQDPWSMPASIATTAAGTLYNIEYSIITVDSPWTITPDNTSRYVIQSGGIFLLSGAAANPFYTAQYYDVLADIWYIKPAYTNMVAAVPTDNSLERVTENSTIWVHSQAAGTHSTSTLQDTTMNWDVNEWSGYRAFIYSGTGVGQLLKITSNTANTLTFTAVTTAPDDTSRYCIQGYDAGIASSSTYNTLVDSTETWEVNQYTNYAVRILWGTGMGQLRRILSNTATSLTLYENWAVQPDATSVYVIQGDSETMYFSWGGSAETFMFRSGDTDILTHGRALDSGIANVACALLCDGTDKTTHVIYEQPPIALSSIAGTTTITATSAQPHGLQAGQWVSIRGVTSAAADIYNTTGKVQILTVPSTTTFTYTPNAAGTGTYAYLTALATTALSDASKDFRDAASGGSTTTVTFTRATPSNINGWYVSGTNIGAGAQVLSGAGTTTLTLSTTGAGTPSGTIAITKWPLAVTGTYSSGGGAGVFTVTLSATTPSYINGWLVTGTNIGIGATVVSGAGTATIGLSIQCAGAPSGTITFSPPIFANNIVYANSAAPAIATGSTASTQMQSGAASTSFGSVMGFLSPITIPVAAVTKYVIAKRDMLGEKYDGQSLSYLSGVALGTQSTTTLVDTNAFWATATGTGTSGLFTITLSAVGSPIHNGWYVSGTGVGVGAKIVAGAGTTTITVDVPNSATVSGTITISAWSQSLMGRRIKMLTSTGVAQELAITAVAPTTGTLTFSLATAGATGTTSYAILPTVTVGAGHEIQWQSNSSDPLKRGRYLIRPRGGAVVGIDRIDLTTDKIVMQYTIPITETLGSGSMFAYDGQDRLYFTKDVTLRVYYVDLNTFWVHGAGMMPYLAGSVGIGNKMEIFTTADGLKFLWVARQQQQECYRQLIFY